MKIGSKIRDLRQSKNITIEKLAGKTGLSLGLVSQIERELVSTSVASLWKISKALEVPIAYFFDEEQKESKIVRKENRKKIILPNSKITYEMLSPNLNRKMEVLLITIKPGECDSDDLISHEGEECGFIIKGRMKVKLGTEEYHLDEEDSIYFDSTTPHRFVNESDLECISIWTMTPPSF